jgi:hypothetical protein
MIVLDANILIRAILGRRVRQLLEENSGPEVRFCAPSAAFADAEKYLPLLLEKEANPPLASLIHSNTFNPSSNLSIRTPTDNSSKKPDCGCVAATRTIGQYLR